jgi:hypothetical protein
MQKTYSRTRDLDFHETDYSRSDEKDCGKSGAIVKPRNREIDRMEVAQIVPMSYGLGME